MYHKVAFLRGINVGGNHKVSMKELLELLYENGIPEAKSYINSGNILFNSNLDNKQLNTFLTQILSSHFGFDIPVVVLDYNEIIHVLDKAPKWWGNDSKDIYDNTIFLIPPVTIEEIKEVMGLPHPEYEEIEDNEFVIYWSFALETHRKAHWYKIHQTSVDNKVTIRTAKTVRKIASLME